MAATARIERHPRRRRDASGARGRRCIATGAVRPKDSLIRFVVAPDGTVVPDLDGRLPGRGLWLTARRDMVETACAKGLFAKAARRAVRVPPELADRVEALLVRRCLDLVGLARRAGAAVAGFERVGSSLRAGKAALLLTARDGRPGAGARMRAQAAGLQLVEAFTGDEIGAALGRDRTAYAALAPGGLAERLWRQASRLEEFRGRGGSVAGQRL